MQIRHNGVWHNSDELADIILDQKQWAERSDFERVAWPKVRSLLFLMASCLKEDRDKRWENNFQQIKSLLETAEMKASLSEEGLKYNGGYEAITDIYGNEVVNIRWAARTKDPCRCILRHIEMWQQMCEEE